MAKKWYPTLGNCHLWKGCLCCSFCVCGAAAAHKKF